MKFDDTKRMPLTKKKTLKSKHSEVMEFDSSDQNKLQLKRRSSYNSEYKRRATEMIPATAIVKKINLSIDDHVSSSSVSCSSSSSHDDNLFTESGVTKSQTTFGEKKLTKPFSSVVDDFFTLYSESTFRSTNGCIIRSNHPYKIAWDMFILALLVFISLVVPVRLAFDF